LIVATLIVFPADLDTGTVNYRHFALRPVRGPDNNLMELQSLCFLGVHQIDQRAEPFLGFMSEGLEGHARMAARQIARSCLYDAPSRAWTAIPRITVSK
jgi:hypothetical protein